MYDASHRITPRVHSHGESPPRPVTPAGLNEIVARMLRGPQDDEAEMLSACFEIDGRFVELAGGRDLYDGLRFRNQDEETNHLEVSAKVLGDVEAGEDVRLAGNLFRTTFRGQDKCLLEVHTLLRGGRHANATAQRICQQLHRLRPHAHPFPSERPLRVSVLVPEKNSTLPDFRGALHDLSEDLLQIEVRPVSMGSAADVADAIAHADGQVVAVIRGGGDEAHLAVFDDPRVLYAMASKPAFTIAGIGHTPDRRLIDLVVDHSADVPANAGRYLRERIEGVGSADARELRAQLAARAKEGADMARRLIQEQARLQEAREALADAERRLGDAQRRRAIESRPEIIERLVPILEFDTPSSAIAAREVEALQARLSESHWRVRALSIVAVVLVIAATAGWVKFMERRPSLPPTASPRADSTATPGHAPTGDRGRHR